MKSVVYSTRAFLEILAETFSHSHTETGGILLGKYEDGVFYVLEVVDPGYSAVHRSSSYFEYDEAYATHVSNTRSRLYAGGLELIGLWHRHPGSFDRFSATDQDTHHRYITQRPEGIISALVNLDPGFRLTTYFVLPQATPHRVQQHDVQIGDTNIPSRILALKHPNDFITTEPVRSPRPQPQPRGYDARPDRRQKPRSIVTEFVDLLFGSRNTREHPPQQRDQPTRRDEPVQRDQVALDMLELEMEDYLEKQPDYTYTVQLEQGEVHVVLEYTGQIPHYPRCLRCLLTAREGNPTVIIEGEATPYRRGAIRRYVEASIENRMRHFDERRPVSADEGLTEGECARILGLTGAFNEQDLKRAYKNLMRDYHPDVWERENDPALASAANRKAQQISAAYQFLMQRYRP